MIGRPAVVARSLSHCEDAAVQDRKIAVVTGAGTGLGKAAALALARDGWHIVAVGRRPDPLTATAEECQQVGGSGSAIAADVTDPAAVEAPIYAMWESGGYFRPQARRPVSAPRRWRCRRTGLGWARARPG